MQNKYEQQLARRDAALERVQGELEELKQRHAQLVHREAMTEATIL